MVEYIVAIAEHELTQSEMEVFISLNRLNVSVDESISNKIRNKVDLESDVEIYIGSVCDWVKFLNDREIETSEFLFISVSKE